MTPRAQMTPFSARRLMTHDLMTPAGRPRRSSRWVADKTKKIAKIRLPWHDSSAKAFITRER